SKNRRPYTRGNKMKPNSKKGMDQERHIENSMHASRTSEGIKEGYFATVERMPFQQRFHKDSIKIPQRFCKDST
ncbi:hypothetical protein, partial [Enterobacter cloacae complex sp. 4DZ1-17B1]|uniref:hypothetical protein n=1 Tax=Enterobacter cloacae complex sp. 4DZ1-17B1 TaxID=2511991 RepID=UPI001CA5C282